MLKRFLCLASVLLASFAQAAQLPPIAFLSMGFRELRLPDLTGTPHYPERARMAGGFLAVTADFNGDGSADEARILVNPERQIAYVVVVTVTTKVDTYVLRMLPLAEIGNIGIKLGPLDGRRTGLVIFEFGGSAALETFNGEEFDSVDYAPNSNATL